MFIQIVANENVCNLKEYENKQAVLIHNNKINNNKCNKREITIKNK